MKTSEMREKVNERESVCERSRLGWWGLTVDVL